MTTANRVDPFANFSFWVEIHGLVLAGFTEVSGLEAETETESYHEGGVNHFIWELPKAVKHPRLVLKRGLTDSDVLWNWYQDVTIGKFQRKNISVLLLDAQGREKIRWNFHQAYPVKWSGPSFKADNSMIAIESLELVHTGFVKGTPFS